MPNQGPVVVDQVVQLHIQMTADRQWQVKHHWRTEDQEWSPTRFAVYDNQTYEEVEDVLWGVLSDALFTAGMRACRTPVLDPVVFDGF